MSTTGGSTWNESFENTPAYGQMARGSIFIGGRSVESPNQMLVYKTTDDGLSWQKNNLTANMGTVYAVAVHPTDKNILFAGGSEVVSGAEQQALFKSTDAGLTWMRTGLTGNGSLQAIVYDPKNSNRMVIGYSKGVLTSTDGGANWQGSYIQQWINCLLADPNTSSRIFAGTRSGVYVTSDGGLDWSPMNTGLTAMTVQCLHLDTFHNVLYAGTSDGGAFRLSLTTGVRNGRPTAERPLRPTLHANFPNPFNLSTQIRYETPERTRARLDILDVNGTVVCVLSDKIEDAGSHCVSWDGSGESGKPVPSGVYFCRLETGQEITVRKMIVQK